MNYMKHGVNGTCAVRDRESKRQVLEVNLRGASFDKNREVAVALCKQLNQGKSLDEVKDLLKSLKANPDLPL